MTSDADLAALARAATPGRWTFIPDEGHAGEIRDQQNLRIASICSGSHGPSRKSAANAKHIAAWSPSRCLAALAVIAAARDCYETLTPLDDALRQWDAL